MSSSAPATGPATGVSTWRIDPDHTQVGFAVKHMMFATVKGQFADVSGEITIDESDASGSAVSALMQASSIDTGNELRDIHLRSADFFDVENHPELTFRGTSMERVGGSKYRITGDLTIRGTTRAVVLDVEQTGRGSDPWGQEKIGFTASTRIDRTDYGLKWNQALEAGGVLVSEEVKVTIDGQAVRT